MVLVDTPYRWRFDARAVDERSRWMANTCAQNTKRTLDACGCGAGC